MSIQICLSKPGDAPKSAIQLNLSKGEKFSIELGWNDDHDLDAHACFMSKGKISALEQVLSTYNVKRPGAESMALTRNADGSFSVFGGAGRHSGDATTGVNTDIDETITIDTDKVPAEIDEIGIFITIHPAGQATFGQVKSPDITVKKSSTVVQAYHLSDQFGQFDAIQAVSFMRTPNGWECAPVGVGFTGNFNSILSQLSS